MNSFKSNTNQMSTSHPERTEIVSNLKRINSDENLSNDKRIKTTTSSSLSLLDCLHYPGESHPNSKQYLIYPSASPSIISKTARFWSLKYLRVLQHVRPEVYHLYIHEDFVSYGELEVIENVILDLAKDFKFPLANEQLPFARTIYIFRRWEALIVLLHKSLAWTRIDHGQRLFDIVRLIDACTLTVIRQVFPQAFFETLEQVHLKQLTKIFDRLVNLKTIIDQTISIGEQFLKLLGYSSCFMRPLEIVYRHNLNFIANNKSFVLNEEKENQTGFSDQSLWQGLIENSRIKTQPFNESFQLIKALETYRKSYPDMGGNAHDLRQWSNERRQLFSINRIEDPTEFWFRM